MNDTQQTAQACTAFLHHSHQDIAKYIEEHYRKSRKVVLLWDHVDFRNISYRIVSHILL